MNTGLPLRPSAASTPRQSNLIELRVRRISALWILPLLLLLLPAEVRAQFNYTTNNGAITITGYTGPGGAVVIPSMINGYPVTSIGNWAFYACSSLTSLTLGTNITSIGGEAFYDCASLAEIYFLGNAPSLGGPNVFSYDNNPTVYYLPGTTGWGSTFGGRPTLPWNSQLPCRYTINDGTLTITKYLGSGGAVEIPASINGLPVTGIGDNAFEFCASLTSIAIPNSVISIGDCAFCDCTNLTSVTIPDNVTGIGDEAFFGCTSLTAITVDALNSVYSSVAGVLFNKRQTTLIEYPAGRAGAYVIPRGVTSIGDAAFRACARLTGVAIGNSVTDIGDEAFCDCTNLTSVTIGNSVTNIGDWAFCACTCLASVTINNSATSIGEWAFCACTNLTNAAIGNGVTSIGDEAFYGCAKLTSITIGNRVTSIGERAFCACTSLTGVTIGNSVTNIGDLAFGSCTRLTGVTIGNSVTNIGDEAFYGCTKLTSVTFGDGVTRIGDEAFFDCTSLASVAIGNRVTSIGDAAFCACASLTSITIPNSVTSIGDQAFYDCVKLTSVTTGNSVASIGFLAFGSCTSLTSVRIPHNVTSIGDGAFSSCTSLTAITVDALNSVYSSEDGVLFNRSRTTLIRCPCGKAGRYTLPNSVVSIGYDAFSDCTGLTSLTLGTNVTSIGGEAFSGCTSLTAIYFQGRPPSLGIFFPFSAKNATIYYLPSATGWGPWYGGRPTAPYPFNYTTDSGKIIITGYTGPGGAVIIPSVISGLPVTSIGDRAFYACTNLSSITLGANVTTTGDEAFSGCTSLTTLTVDALNSVFSSVAGVLCNKNQTTLIEYPEGRAGAYAIPSSVTSIGDKAFCACASLTGVTIGKSVTRIGDKAFYDCTNLTGVTIGNSVTNIGDEAFYGCTKLTSVTFGDGVTRIGDEAFFDCTSLTSVTIPRSVTSIGVAAFCTCTSLKAITVDAQNSVYSSAAGVLFDKSQTTLIEYPGGKTGGYTIPDSVVSIGYVAFLASTHLTSLTLGASVTRIGDEALAFCRSLTEVYFQGPPPSLGDSVFFGDNNATVYYVPCTTGWGPTYGDRPAVLWTLSIPAKGVYHGLFYQTNGFELASSGNFTIALTSAGAFSGNLKVDGNTYPLSGKFDPNGAASVSIARRGKSALAMDLQLDPTKGAGRLTGTVSDGTWTAWLSGDRAVFNAKTSPAPQAGRYTMVIPGVEASSPELRPLPNPLPEPQGYGYAVISVSAGGLVTLTGTLADGTAVSQTSTLSKDGEWPFYLRLYRNQGCLAGWLSFTNLPSDDLTGELNWLKPNVLADETKVPNWLKPWFPALEYYPNGFTLRTAVLGSRYSLPSPGQRVLNLTNALVRLNLDDGAVAITNRVILDDHNRAQNQSANSLNLNLATSTGLFTGWVADPKASKRLSYKGVVLQKRNAGYGYFFSTNQSGSVYLGPE